MQRFHDRLYRALLKRAEASADEKGMQVAFVDPRGMLAWAFGISGPMRLNRHAHGQATCRTGKRRGRDLSASYEVDAR